jgi:hypothetical protein
VEGATEDNDVLSACSNSCQFDRAFYRFRTGVAEEESINRRRHNFAKFFDQSQHGLMDDDICLGVQKESRLLSNRFNNLRMAMSRICHSNPTGKVKQSLAIRSVDIGTFGALGNKVEKASPNGRHMWKIFGVELIHFVIPYSKWDRLEPVPSGLRSRQH